MAGARDDADSWRVIEEALVGSRVRVEVKGLVVDAATNVPMVVLRATEGEDFVLPIWVGVFEANAIALKLEGIETPRPMTHDLLRDVVHALGGSVEAVVVTDMRESTFLASIQLRAEGGRPAAVDARPSDALALALRTGAPIYLDPAVLEKAQAYDPGSHDPDKLRQWFQGLETGQLGQDA